MKTSPALLHLAPHPTESSEYRYRSGASGQVIEVAVALLNGSARGVYLCLRVLHVTGETDVWDVFAGASRLIRRLPRASKRALAEVAEAADAHVVDLAAAWAADPVQGQESLERLVAHLRAS